MIAAGVMVAVCIAVAWGVLIHARRTRLPRVTEYQARQNAAPLTSAILSRHIQDRGDQ